MHLTYDPAKNQRNIRERALPFDLVARCDWHKARQYADRRREYGEERITAYVPLQGRLHVVVYTMRGQALHVISFRKANHREEKFYENA